jgi:RNA polymerase sigma factor (sigma-70 family)
VRSFPPAVTGGKLPPITEGVTSSQASDAELLADSADPAESFAIFYRRHAEAVLRFAASRGADAHTAADVVAETFLAAMRRRTHYRPQHESARLWLLGIAVRRLADVRRSEERERRRIERAADHARVLTDVDRASYAVLLENSEALDALADLPEADREAILARVVEDRSYAEIAEALGLTEPTTRKRVSRGLARLRTRLERM